MESKDIRLKILKYLYKMHYSPKLGEFIMVNKMIEGAGLMNIARQDVLAEIYYLRDKGRIKVRFLTPSYTYDPHGVMISAEGIDEVERQTGWDTAQLPIDYGL
jgi:hypothetical protein